MHVKTNKSPSSWMKRTNRRSQEQLPGPGHPTMTPDIWPLEHPPRQPPSTYRPRTSGHSPDIRPSPDIRAFPWKSGIERQNAPEAWPLQPGHPARAWTSGDSRSPGHLAPSPDIRHLPACRERAKGPCIPLSLTPSWSSTIYTPPPPPS